MPELNIVSIGIEILGATNINHSNKEDLSQYEIIIFDSNIRRGLNLGFDYFSDESKYLPKDSYLKLRESCNYWSKQLAKAYKTGKLIFVISSPCEVLTVHSGGTTHNPKGGGKTLTTSTFSTYSCFPFEFESDETNGTVLRNVKNKYETITEKLYEDLKQYTKYKVEFTNIPHAHSPVLSTKTGELLSFYRENENNGKYLFWPYIDFNNDAFIEKKQTGWVWSKEGQRVCKIFIGHLVALYKAKQNEKEAMPDWVSQDKSFITNKETQILNDIKKNNSELEKLNKKTQALQTSLEKEPNLRALLYATGIELQDAVNNALSILGLKSKTYNHPKAILEIDNLIKYKDIEIIGETEGKEKDINNVKIGQLSVNLNQYYTLEIERLSKKPKGVLFGNPERLKPINKRTLTFTEKCLQISTSEKIALVLTKDLFKVALYLADNQDERFRIACIDAMLSTEHGIVLFPEAPIK